MNFDKVPAKVAEEKITWMNPDGTIGSGTEADRKETIENWDRG